MTRTGAAGVAAVALLLLIVMSIINHLRMMPACWAAPQLAVLPISHSSTQPGMYVDRHLRPVNEAHREPL